MQVVLWLIFAATFGGAIVLSNGRAQLTRVSLGAAKKLGTGRQTLLIQLPEHWTIHSGLERGVYYAAARDENGDGQFERVLLVTEEALDQGPITAGEYLMSRTSETPLRVQPFNFKRLGAGTLIETPGGTISQNDDRLATRPAIYACCIVPASRNSPRPIAVIVELQGPVSFGSTGVALLQTVADSIGLAPDKTVAGLDWQGSSSK